MAEKTIIKLERCRICKGKKFFPFLKLRSMPRPNGFLKKPIKEERYPLDVSRCQTCGHVQLDHVISAKALFSRYLYMSSMSKTMLDHFRTSAKNLVKRFKLKPGASVMDIGSNDGIFLSTFPKGIKTLGIDPAKNLKAVAQARGVETYVAFFSEQTAKTVLKKYGPADLISGINVFAHIHDLDGVFDGVQVLLKKDGVLLMEFPYLVDLVAKKEFDTIYHEHLSYFLLKPLQLILARHGLEIFDAERFPTHGGTVRLYVQRTINKPYTVTSSVVKLGRLEDRLGMYKDATYAKFSKNIQSIPVGLIALVKKLRKANKRVIGYGASAKANVLLNMCGFGPKDVEYIVDSTPYKQGLYTPGAHIPIVSEERLKEDRPDYAIMFIWNFLDEVLKKQQGFLKRGGKFIVPVPKIKII
ncbi:MAG: class I SAM-dependent methyltransferase [bacterium]|nr:class I SAM-dependent methyltransferase [bacterium]